MLSAKLNNFSLITPISHFFSRLTNIYLSPFKILMITLMLLLELSTVVVIAAPLTPEITWSAVVKPITWSPVTTHRDQISTQLEPFQKWWNSISSRYAHNSKLAWMVTKSYSLHNTCRGKDRSKIHDGESRHNKKQCGKNQYEKNKCGQNYHDKHCGKDQHWKHCSKDLCDKPFDRDRHEKHCAKNRNGGCRRGMNFREQNKQQKMKNGNKHREFIVDNKVVINISSDQTIQTPSPTLLAVETTTPVLVSTKHESVEQSSGSCSLWAVEICLLIYCICFLIALCLIRV